jgi:hypothetical protein
MAPLCTALTIMALRRATHRFVSGGGKLTGIVFNAAKPLFRRVLEDYVLGHECTIVSQSPQWSSVPKLLGSPIIAPLTSPRRGADGERGRYRRDLIRVLVDPLPPERGCFGSGAKYKV